MSKEDERIDDPLHDPSLCLCGFENACTCPCKKCETLRKSALRILRMKILEDRLEVAGIHKEDFADLIWSWIEPAIEQRIEKLAKDALRNMLKNVKLFSTVQGSSVDW